MKKYLVIGNPIAHSLSPKLHNNWLRENNIEASYDKIKLNLNEIESFIDSIKQKKVAGCNVTVPFKKTVIPYLDGLSPEAKKTQSVNTIAFDGNNLVGHNTDIFGFRTAIERLNFSIQDKNVLILGAGGVVPSIIFALKRMNVSEIKVSNRTKQKAEDLKILYKDLEIIEWGDLPDFDVIINATSIGLNNETMNLDFSKSGKNKLFYDVIYNPVETHFLKKGKELGNMAENGRTMFIYQAAEAFKIWHGIGPKINQETLKLLEND